MKCKDVNGKELDAIKVYAHCIRFFKDCVLKDLETDALRFYQKDFKYVLTVPSTCGEKAKMFLKEAAQNVRI